MRTFKLITGLIVVLAFSAVAVATASAAETLWKWLPGAAKTAMKAKTGKATLRAEKQAAIECTKSSGTGEMTEPSTDATLALLLLSFEGCKAGGLFEALSLGDTKEIILVHVEVHNCVINAAKKELGLLIKVLPVHIDVPANGLLLTVEGAEISKIESKAGSLTAYTITTLAEAKGPKQAIKLCEGGAEQSLTSLVDAEPAPFKSSEEALEGELSFTAAQDIT